MNEQRLKEIAWRHHHTLITDWAKELDPLAQTQSYNNARECHQDRAELITMIESLQAEIAQRDKALKQARSLLAEIAQRDKALKQARSLLMQIDCMNTDCCSRWVSGESNKRDYCQWCVDRSKVLENSE